MRHEPVVWVAPLEVEVEKESPLPLAVFHHGCMFRKWALEALAEQGIAYRIAYSSPSTTGVLAAVKAGLAVAPVGASIPRSGLRVLEDSVLNNLPSAVVSLHHADKPASQAHLLLSKYNYPGNTLPFCHSQLLGKTILTQGLFYGNPRFSEYFYYFETF